MDPTIAQNARNNTINSTRDREFPLREECSGSRCDESLSEFAKDNIATHFTSKKWALGTLGINRNDD